MSYEDLYRHESEHKCRKNWYFGRQSIAKILASIGLFAGIVYLALPEIAEGAGPARRAEAEVFASGIVEKAVLEFRTSGKIVTDVLPQETNLRECDSVDTFSYKYIGDLRGQVTVLTWIEDDGVLTVVFDLDTSVSEYEWTTR